MELGTVLFLFLFQLLAEFQHFIRHFQLHLLPFGVQVFAGEIALEFCFV